MPKPTKKSATSEYDAEAEAIMRLIDHAKKQGIAYFEGPRGIKFAFRKEVAKKTNLAKPEEIGDEWLPEG